MIERFIIYGLAGWCMEIIWTGIGSFLDGDIYLNARTYIWMFPIYGLAILFEPIHDRIRAWPVIIRGGVYTLLIFIIEYLAGWTLQNIIGVCPWDYGDSTFSIDGFIRLDYAPAWFAAGLIFERIHDLLNSIEIRRRRV
ncbi:MAG TPA: hypothetical protein PLL17_07495 [Defluviitaleaceae bacterium]|nr:hypothetical protein [Candidatus Epulonipiscium sp.]HPT75107.1 hypothetical protein [Defluviitaleaceae bacterium]HQD50951.1 hypothetical protein [Defluviitaleaceae bacterium]